jgi:hypothetical protein
VEAAGVVELTTPIDIYVLPDVTPLLLSINADVRPTQPTVDGVIGTTVLSRMVQTLDYPNRRMVANCAASSDCVAYAEVVPTAPGTCAGCIGYCNKNPDLRAQISHLDSQCAVAP